MIDFGHVAQQLEKEADRTVPCSQSAAIDKKTNRTCCRKELVDFYNQNKESTLIAGLLDMIEQRQGKSGSYMRNIGVLNVLSRIDGNWCADEDRIEIFSRMRKLNEDPTYLKNYRLAEEKKSVCNPN